MSRKTSAKNGVAVPLLLLVMLVDAWAGYEILFGSGIAKGVGLALHLVVLLPFRFLLKRLRLRSEPLDPNFVFITFLLALALPGYGIVGTLLLCLALTRVEVEPADYFELDEAFVSSRYRFFVRGVDRQILSIKKDELDVDAFRDVFKSNDAQMEANAVNKLSKMLTREAVSILREVVDTSQSDTKILAASALIDMEDRIIKRIEEIKQELKANPNNYELVLALARTYDLYCYLGILDPAVEDYYRGLAIEQYQRFMRHNPEHPEANLEYGRILLNARKYEEAIPVLKNAVALSPGNPSPLLWLAEAFYELTDYQAVRAVCAKLRRFDDVPRRFKDIAAWWESAEPLPQN